MTLKQKNFEKKKNNNLSAEVFRFWSKNSWFYKILEKQNKTTTTKKKPTPKIMVCCVHKTGVFFFSPVALGLPFP